MNKDTAVALVRTSRLADRADRVVSCLQPSLRLRATRRPEAAQELVSRFGGTGYLPRGVPWPTWAAAAMNRRWIEFVERRMALGRGSSKVWREGIEGYERAMRAPPRPLDYTDEDGPGWLWGDAGRLYFCLHRDDLAARRFERSWCVMQCG
jgi:hypothetical protein